MRIKWEQNMTVEYMQFVGFMFATYKTTSFYWQWLRILKKYL
jgi:hypothetical protein